MTSTTAATTQEPTRTENLADRNITWSWVLGATPKGVETAKLRIRHFTTSKKLVAHLDVVFVEEQSGWTVETSKHSLLHRGWTVSKPITRYTPKALLAFAEEAYAALAAERAKGADADERVRDTFAKIDTPAAGTIPDDEVNLDLF